MLSLLEKAGICWGLCCEMSSLSILGGATTTPGRLLVCAAAWAEIMSAAPVRKHTTALYILLCDVCVGLCGLSIPLHMAHLHILLPCTLLKLVCGKEC